MVKEELISKINQVMAEEFEADPSLIKPEAPLMETLDLDSLDLVDVVVLIDTNFGVSLTAQDFVGMKTFQDFYDLISRKLDEKK